MDKEGVGFVPGVPVGLLAGKGNVPPYFAKKAQEFGVPVISFSLAEEASENLKPFVLRNHPMSIGQAGKLKKVLAKEKIDKLIIMGKVDKEMIYKFQKFDLESLKILFTSKNHQDKSLHESVIDMVQGWGVTILDQMCFMPELFPDTEWLSRKKPSQQTLKDARFGFPVAKYMADQEIGQTLLVKNETVVAVEAVEGTDAAIERGLKLSRGGSVVIKVSRSEQDYRFDCPAVGPRTIEKLIEGGSSGLALETGRVMLIDRPRVIDLADKAGLPVFCI